jgi:hypothetical protein
MSKVDAEGMLISDLDIFRTPNIPVKHHGENTPIWTLGYVEHVLSVVS